MQMTTIEAGAWRSLSFLVAFFCCALLNSPANAADISVEKWSALEKLVQF